MNNVRFQKNGLTGLFGYGDGDSFRFPYHTGKLWPDIDINSFDVQLLINPMLNRESSDIYSLDVKGRDGRIGFVFPISVLDSELVASDCPTRFENYVYAAFFTLLERIKSIEDGSSLFSENFEDNICVCVINRREVPDEHPLHLIIHSLRKYGYSYFVDYNSVKAVEGYKRENVRCTGTRALKVKIGEPRTYSIPIVDVLLRHLPNASNLVHRFVLLYQFIEALLDIQTQKDIQAEIETFHQQRSCNDFLNNVKNIDSEIVRLRTIFDSCHINGHDCADFKSSCDVLFNIIGYPYTKGDADRFYAFRNQMTHSYRAMQSYQEELADTIQQFERLVMIILERYEP